MKPAKKNTAKKKHEEDIPKMAEVGPAPLGEPVRLPARPIHYIPLHLMFAPPYQRSIKPGWAHRSSGNFKPDAVRLFDVSERKDGRYAILDGHQRWNLLLRMGYTEAECVVHTGLSYSEEARLFCDLNGITVIRAFDLWVAALEEGRADVVAIQKIAVMTGHVIPKNNTGSTHGDQLIAVHALQYVYGMENGDRLLESVLRLAKKAWGAYSPSGIAIKAMAHVLQEHPDGCESTMLISLKENVPTFRSLEAHAQVFLADRRREGKALGGGRAMYAVLSELIGKKRSRRDTVTTSTANEESVHA